MNPDRFFLFMIYAFIIILAGLILMLPAARGHDYEQPSLNGWYQSLMQPDNPGMSCCGVADTYWCDDLESETLPDDSGKMVTKNYCRITDDRDDAMMKHRPHVDIGTRIHIPNNKIKWSTSDPQTADANIERNPTGHSMVFLSRGLYVYCFIAGVLM